MPQITTAFAPDFVTTMRWALDAASDRVPVTSRTPATKAKMAQRIVRSAHEGVRDATNSWRRRWPKAWCPRSSVVPPRSQRSLPTTLRGPMQLQSTLTCPVCQHQAVETMPTDACKIFYDCESCGTRLKPLAGDCCVFCSYASVPCPPIQENGKAACCS